MASAVLTQRNLWLSLSDIPDRYRAIYLDEPVSAMGLFAQSLYGIQAEFELRKKQTEALHSIIARRDAKPKPPVRVRKLAVLPPRSMRSVPSASLGSHSYRTEG